MDRTSQQVIAGFYTAPNKALLRQLIVQKFGKNSGEILPLLDNFMENFRVRMQKELAGNDPVVRAWTGDIVLEQIYQFDHKFIEAIADNFTTAPPEYGISDGLPVSNGQRNGQLIQSMDADSTLRAWRERSGRPLTLRGDTQYGQAGETVFGSRYQSGNLGAPYVRDAPFAGDGLAGRGGYSLGGIQFADQSGVGLNEYYTAYMERPAMKKWNDESRPFWRDAPIGHNAADEDRKAFTQRYMRSYDGCDGAIPSYRRWLHNRHVDYDNGETFAGPEHEFIQRGYDRTSLLNRIAGIRAVGREEGSFPLRSMLNPPRNVN